jgi:hypothetical protein
MLIFGMVLEFFEIFKDSIISILKYFENLPFTSDDGTLSKYDEKIRKSEKTTIVKRYTKLMDNYENVILNNITDIKAIRVVIKSFKHYLVIISSSIIAIFTIDISLKYKLLKDNSLNLNFEYLQHFHFDLGYAPNEFTYIWMVSIIFSLVLYLTTHLVFFWKLRKQGVEFSDYHGKHLFRAIFSIFIRIIYILITLLIFYGAFKFVSHFQRFFFLNVFLFYTLALINSMIVLPFLEFYLKNRVLVYLYYFFAIKTPAFYYHSKNKITKKFLNYIFKLLNIQID